MIETYLTGILFAYGKARRWIDGALGCFFNFASYKNPDHQNLRRAQPRLTGPAALVYFRTQRRFETQIAGALKMRLKRDIDPSGAAATDFLFQAWSGRSDPRDLRAACIRVTKC